MIILKIICQMKNYLVMPNGWPEKEAEIPLLLTVGPTVPALKLLVLFLFKSLNVPLNCEQLRGLPLNLTT